MNPVLDRSADLDVQLIRDDFPILHQLVNGHPLVYFDNAATTQKPRQVIEAISQYYEQYNSNVHRGVHALSERATESYEEARSYIAQFINAKHNHEVNFVRGVTEGVNLVASAWGRKFVKAGDEVIISGMDHHSNIVPWQMLGEEKGAIVKAIPVTDSAELDLDAFQNLLTNKTKIVAVAHTCNATGVINPIERIIEMAHEVGALVLIDGAQAMAHDAVDVQLLDCDFFAFSGHKVFGPTGIGALFGKEDHLQSMNPYMGGGEMIEEVTLEKSTYNKLPYKFEAGTPNIAGGIALAEALKYVESVGYNEIQAHEQALIEYGSQRLQGIEDLTLLGKDVSRAAVFSFNVGKIHSYDVGVLLDQQGIAIRTGHHCCMPLMTRFGVSGTCRASLAVYNTKEEIDLLTQALKKAVEILA